MHVCLYLKGVKREKHDQKELSRQPRTKHPQKSTSGRAETVQQRKVDGIMDFDSGDENQVRTDAK